ncbi:MAG: hypothetical protein VYA34_05970 [Myxococcota bacterium]|nr:hypothetical protein [Myxococcota bacterium]
MSSQKSIQERLLMEEHFYDLLAQLPDITDLYAPDDPTELQEVVSKLERMAALKNLPEPEQQPTSHTKLAPIIPIRPIEENERLFVEQNFGMEFPVCVASKKDRRRLTSLEYNNSDGGKYVLAREANGALPAPEHNPLWQWALMKFSIAARQVAHIPLSTAVPAPKVGVDVRELARLLERSAGGSFYDFVDDAFKSFAGITVTATNVVYDAKTKRRRKSIGKMHLIEYQSWREEADELEGEQLAYYEPVASLSWIQPSNFLWENIRANFVLPITSIRELAQMSYVAQRLTAWLKKHGQTQPRDGWFATTLLKKIPLKLRSYDIKSKLRKPHSELMALSVLLSEPEYSGRGQDIKIKYHINSAFLKTPAKIED